MKNYGVLKGKAKQFLRDHDDDPHSELLVDAAGHKFRVAINVRSSRGPVAKRLVEYLILEDVQSALVDHVKQLPLGWTDLRVSERRGAAVDYIRSNLFRAQDLKPLVHDTPGPDNDLFEKIEALLERAIEDDSATVYAFGETWPPESQPDKYFQFTPGRGVHDIHMNQGNPGDDNAVFEDGALLLELPSAGVTTGLFIKFQNQSWHTDEQTGDPIPGAPVAPEPEIPPEGPIEPWVVVPVDSPYRLAKLVGAMINPSGEDPGKESVTIFNLSSGPLNVDGWSILDRNDKPELLSGTIPLGEARTFHLSGKGAQLSNQGGTITLLNAEGLKVDGVAYAKAAAAKQGAAIAL